MPRNAVPRPRDLVEVIHADALESLSRFPDGLFDAVITDPPFAIGLTKNEGERPNWDRSRVAFDPVFWAEVRRVTKRGGNLLAFGHSRTYPRMVVGIEDAGWRTVDTLAWINGQGYAAGYRSLDQELLKTGSPELAVDYIGMGNMLRPAFEPVLLARNLGKKESLVQTIADGGTGGFNIDASRIPAGDENRSRTPGKVNDTATWRVHRAAGTKSSPSAQGRLPSNVILQHSPDCETATCADDCPVEQVRQQGRATRGRNEDAARLYTTLHHPKATRSERPEVDGITGPTVKPLGVMDWLVRLALRPGQLCLDPFAGSGTTLESCARLGIRAVGIEREAAYLPLIEQRLSRL